MFDDDATPPEDLEGSMLGEVLKPFLDANAGIPAGAAAGVFVAPVLGINFMPPWKVA